MHDMRTRHFCPTPSSFVGVTFDGSALVRTRSLRFLRRDRTSPHLRPGRCVLHAPYAPLRFNGPKTTSTPAIRGCRRQTPSTDWDGFREGTRLWRHAPTRQLRMIKQRLLLCRISRALHPLAFIPQAPPAQAPYVQTPVLHAVNTIAAPCIPHISRSPGRTFSVVRFVLAAVARVSWQDWLANRITGFFLRRRLTAGCRAFCLRHFRYPLPYLRMAYLRITALIRHTYTRAGVGARTWA